MMIERANHPQRGSGLLFATSTWWMRFNLIIIHR
jgi:hypothetical protein